MCSLTFPFPLPLLPPLPFPLPLPLPLPFPPRARWLLLANTEFGPASLVVEPSSVSLLIPVPAAPACPTALSATTRKNWRMLRWNMVLVIFGRFDCIERGNCEKIGCSINIRPSRKSSVGIPISMYPHLQICIVAFFAIFLAFPKRPYHRLYEHWVPVLSFSNRASFGLSSGCRYDTLDL